MDLQAFFRLDKYKTQIIMKKILYLFIVASVVLFIVSIYQLSNQDQNSQILNRHYSEQVLNAIRDKEEIKKSSSSNIELSQEATRYNFVVSKLSSRVIENDETVKRKDNAYFLFYLAGILFTASATCVSTIAAIKKDTEDNNSTKKFLITSAILTLLSTTASPVANRFNDQKIEAAKLLKYWVDTREAFFTEYNSATPENREKVLDKYEHK